jgi:hypothetical protein
MLNKRRPGWALLVILLAGAMGIFVLPWHVPINVPSASLSYRYGFNNSVAILATGLTLGALFLRTLWQWRNGINALANTTFASTFDFRGGTGTDRGLLYSFLGASVIFPVVIVAMYCYTPIGEFAEMGYFLPKIELMVMHKVPYRDYPFYYGPAFLYVPFFLYNIAHGILSIEQSYAVILVVNWILGLGLLAICTRMLIPEGRRVVVFWAFAIMFLNPMLGYQYTLLRYTLPVAGLLMTHWAVQNSAACRLKGHLCVSLFAFMASFLNFEISPEMGVSVTLALLVYFISLLRTEHRVFAHGAAMVLLGACAVVVPLGSAYLGIVLNYGGGFNLPLLPGPSVLLFLVANLAVLPLLAAIGIKSDRSLGPLSIAYSVLAGILIAAALGRCDVGHLYFNGFAIFFLSIGLLARLPDQRWFQRALFCLLVLLILSEWPFVFHFKFAYSNAHAARLWMRSHPIANASPANGFVFSKPYPPMTNLDPLLAYGPIATPLGCTENVERFLMLHGIYQTGYFLGNCEEVLGPNEAARQSQELEGFHTILVRTDQFQPIVMADDHIRKDLSNIEGALLCPCEAAPKLPVFDPEYALASRILKEYKVIGEFGDYRIMARRTGAN